MNETTAVETLDRKEMYANEMLLDYLANSKKMKNFLSAEVKQIHKTPYEGDRGVIQEILLKYNKEINAEDKVIKNIELITDKDTYFVITGQQPGFLLGPLYTIFKTISAINYAERFSSKTRKLIPLFWNASEDHDVQEVNNIKILTESNDIENVEITDSSMMGKSLERLALNKELLREQIEVLKNKFPSTDFSPYIFDEVIDKELRKSKYWGEFFSRLMSRLMGKWGVILLEPKILRNELQELFEEIIVDPIKFNDIFLETTHQLEELGYQPKMHKKRTVAGLFYIDKEGYRKNITYSENNNMYTIGSD